VGWHHIFPGKVQTRNTLWVDRTTRPPAGFSLWDFAWRTIWNRSSMKLLEVPEIPAMPIENDVVGT
jgi:hypothetical protein